MSNIERAIKTVEQVGNIVIKREDTVAERTNIYLNGIEALLADIAISLAVIADNAEN